MKAALAFALLAPIAASAGDLYRCTAADGKVEYRDTPCATTAATKRIDARQSTQSLDAEMNRARVARENAEFNERFDAREKARREADAQPYYQAEPIYIERQQEPTYLPYAVNTCGGYGQPKCRYEVEIKKPAPHRPPSSITVPRKDLSTVGR